jgi:hemerythrin-like domain-containing protein
LKQWRENFAYLAKQKCIYLSINQTLSGLTIKTIPDLLKFVNGFRNEREIGHHLSTTVFTYDFLHPKIFGSGFWDQDFDQILNLMPEHNWQNQEAKKYMTGVWQALNNNTSRDSDQIAQLVTYLDEIDQRRGLNWRSTFPWLVKEVDHVV